MSGLEFDLHWADYRRSPWDERRGDERAALIAATMINIAPNRRKGAKPATVGDLLLYPDKEKFHEPDADEIRAFMNREG